MFNICEVFMKNLLFRSIAALSLLVSVVSFGMKPATELSRLQQQGLFGAFSPVMPLSPSSMAVHRSNITFGDQSAYLNGIPSTHAVAALNMLADVSMTSDKSIHGAQTK